MNPLPAVVRLHPALPIFSLRLPTDAVVYLPGHLRRVTRLECEHLRLLWNGQRPAAVPSAVGALAVEFECRAAQAAAAWHTQLRAPFSPECLTVYLNNRCNCRCVYCYAAEPRTAGQHAESEERVSLEALVAAARVVAAACREKGRPFQLVLHGGGEPTLDFRLVQAAVRETQAIAASAGCDWRGHLATNGVMSVARAAWVASHFDSIGLSLDGPPELHDRQRPLRTGRPSLPVVERTLRLFQAGPARICLRATVLPAAVDRLVEIVDVLVGRFQAREVRLEPAYRLDGIGHGAFAEVHADRFVAAFLAARAHGQARGATIDFSGVRPGETHGPYCNVLREVLHLVPGDVASACFFCTGAADSQRRHVAIGAWSARAGKMLLDPARIAAHRRRALRLPPACQNCIAVFHCSRGCPDVCIATGNPVPAPPAFRCGIHRGIAAGLILEAAAKLPGGHGQAEP